MDHSRLLSEDEAHRLLARAVELDAQHERPVTLAELRAVALEAGIAPEAFDRAVVEAGQGASLGPTVPRPFWRSLVANAKATVVFWLVLILLVRACTFFDVGWVAREFANLLAVVAGIVAALQFRARVARTLFLGVGVALLVEWVVHLVYGLSAVQAAANHLAVMGAGVVAALSMEILTRFRMPRRGGDTLAATSPVETDTPQSGISDRGILPRALTFRAV